MTERSFPIVDEPLSADQWQTITLGLGRGIVDRGGNPYWLSNKDSVTNTVTIGVDSLHDYNEAILDGFAHKMDAPKQISLPPVTTATKYEIGLVYDPNSTNPAGPITLEAWVAPGDTSNDVSRLPLWEVTRSANVSLANSPHREIRPRVSPGIAVSRFADLPTAGLVLSDMVALVREEGRFYRSAVASGSVQWISIGGGGGDLDSATHLVEPGTIVRRWSGNGTVHMPDPIAPADAANKRYVDSRGVSWDSIADKPSAFWPATHTHTASVIQSGEFDNARVKGSSKAYSRTNVGSTWASVVANPNGDFGRYPSALKYKKNIRAWNPDPQTILDMVPVQYDLRTDVTGESTDSDRDLIGFIADSYVETRRELVLKNGDEIEGFHYHLMPVAQQIVLRHLDRKVKDQQAELDLLRSNQAELLAFLGLGTDADGRVITNESGA